MSTYELEFLAGDDGDVHVVGGRRQIFQLLVGEDVEGDQVNLGVTVLASLGGGHFDDLARATLDHDVAVLAQGRALHRVGGRGTGIGALEGVLMLKKNCQLTIIVPKANIHLKLDGCMSNKEGGVRMKAGQVSLRDNKGRYVPARRCRPW
jgi:hypothetical protein